MADLNIETLRELAPYLKKAYEPFKDADDALVVLNEVREKYFKALVSWCEIQHDRGASGGVTLDSSIELEHKILRAFAQEYFMATFPTLPPDSPSRHFI